MGRILFLSAVAFLAYKYIARSNQKHQAIDAPDNALEVLPPEPAEAKLVAAGSSAIEPDPGR